MQAINPGYEIIDLGSDSEDPVYPTDDFFPLSGEQADLENDDYGLENSQYREIPGPTRSQTVHINAPTQYESSLSEVLEVFPDISHDHVRQLYETWIQANGSGDRAQEQNVAAELTIQIVDAGEYPKEKDRINDLKRKRSQALNSDEEEEVRWKDATRELDTCTYNGEARVILQEEFVNVPSRFIDSVLKERGHFFATYLALDLAEYTYSESKSPPYTRLKVPRKIKPTGLARLEEMEAKGYATQELKKEILAARNRRQKTETKRKIKKDIAIAEAATDQEYRNSGDVMECQCCYETTPINKLTHCNGAELHVFCLECATSYAKNLIGDSRYDLRCMAGDDCTAQFDREQKHRFLDASSLEALERIQQQAELRLADLPNLSACPFCDFAAICPPIKVDKEFRCRNPECERVSCRLCKLDSHVPLTCSESKKENGVSERHLLEEARTAALLRTCPKCKVKILKEEGCNKVVCTCGGMMCDVCGSDISKIGYKHFDSGVGGPRGKKCPTYDDSYLRRNKDIEMAEAAALKQIRAENPNLTEEDLKINFNEAVKSPPRPYHHPMVPPGLIGFPNQPRFPGHRVGPPPHYPAPPGPQQIPGVGAMPQYGGAYRPGDMPPPIIRPPHEFQQDLENLQRIFNEAHPRRVEDNGQRMMNPATNINERMRAAEARINERMEERRRVHAPANRHHGPRLPWPDFEANVRALGAEMGNRENRIVPEAERDIARRHPARMAVPEVHRRGEQDGRREDRGHEEHRRHQQRY